MSQQMSQQRVVKQSSSVQQQSSSFSMQQSSVQQQSQTQTKVVRQVQQGVQRVQGPTQMVPVGLPAGASPPVFEQIFQNARFAQGGDALFEGKVQGSPKPTVTWTRRGQQISSGNKYEVSHDEVSGVVTLLIRAIGPGDEGEYTCTAANQYGEAICTVYIQPEAAYMMQQQRQQMQQSSVQSQMHIQKQQQMQLMQNGYSESFRVDSFEYRLMHEVEFRQSLCMRLEGEVDLGGITIQGPPTAPQLQQKPRSTKVSDGGNATFSVSLHANPSPRVIWFKNGARLQQSEKYLMTASAGQATLVIKNVNSNDNGYYTMLAENKSGCSVASAQLAVVPKGEEGTNGIAPEIIRPTSAVEPMEVETDESGKTLEPKFVLVPRDRESQEGKMVRFDCRVTGRPYPEVTWFLNGQTIIDDATHKVLVNEAGNHSLMITEVSLMDNGTITCVARNKSGETSFQVALHVLEREQLVSPKFVERFQQGQVKEGETVVLHARAVGTPMPSMSWQKDGVAIENSEYMQIQSDGQGSSNLQILAASVADAGWFSCNASNVAGSTSTRARLHVVADKNAPAMPQRPHFPKPTKVIEPQPEPQPEIINLRPVERAHHQPRAPEEEKPTEPPQFTVPLRDIDLEEGKRAHFEAKLAPVGDATMNVEWLIDGRPLSASSRATTTYRFGYVALDILNVIKADSGVYTCRASNVMGQAEVSANLRISEKPIIDTSSQHTDAMKQINYLEQQTHYQKNVSIEEAVTIKPNFVKPLANLGEVSEGKYAHFEAQLHPVSDPFMRIEWFKDGKTITASSRINVIYNFGYVALNIMHLRPEDSGTYSVRATNKAGECTCSATIKVIAVGNVTGDLGIPEQSSYIKSVEEMEAYRLQMLQRQTTEFVQSTAAPVFKSELKDTSAREGGYAHFEARLEPIGDPGLKVEWFKDGRPIEASARITSFFNFGYVALTIKQLIIQDAGTYTCVATNTLGKIQVQCTLVVISKTEKEVESHYSETVQKMEYMEDSSRYQKTETEETTVTIAPKFVGQMKGTNKIVEGQKAHFEVRLEPQSDSTMTVEWYFNSQVIMSASRIKLYNDFGYVSLDISDVRSSDSGTYTVVARNALGEAQLSTQMIVETRSSIDYSTMHEVTMTKTTAMERRAHQEPQYDVGDYSKAKPAFTVMLADPKPVPEGKNIHLEARLEPVGDPTMKVDWFFNGKALTVGSRFKTYFDFGFVALDILSVYANDSGEYTCRAENALGSAHTSAQVVIVGTSFIESETMHGEAMEQISYLESSRNQKGAQDDSDITQPPTFVKSLKNIETIEGTNIHLEARLQPVGDSSMRIEWFFNDEPLKVGHRFRPAYDFDYVALDLLSVYPYDSGIYTCRATNALGQAVSSASVKITEGSGVIITNEQTTLTKEQLTMLEERNRYSRTEVVEETTKQAPVFTTALKNIEILEGQRAHFEVRLIPTSDPTMKIEWFHDNKPIKSGSRFTEYNDFGFVALDIMYAYAEDSGTYTCVATNCLGQATSSCTLLCHTKESILVDTMNAEAMSKITQLETRSSRTVTAEEAVMQAPVFTAPMKDQNLLENAPLHFEARLIPVGDPELKVEWFKNGVPIQQANRITTMHDFGYVALDMKYVNPEDSGTYTCRATNRLGQAVTSATLVVSSKESLLMESQHSEALEKLRYLEDSSRYSKTTTEETVITTAPRFTVQLSGLTQLWEGQSAHVECRLEPYPDPSMKVEWFHNGKPLNVGHRFRTMYDFGFCAMDILSAVAEDSGTYEVKATNRIGTASSSITIEIKAKSDFIVDTQHPEAMNKIARLEQKSAARTPDDIQMVEKPNFGRPLRNLENLIEGQAMHMEATLTPVNDATMKVEWFFNGQPVPSGHRFRTTYDFGFVALDVLYAYPEDSGTYMCKATNVAGQAVTSCTVKITEVEGMQTQGDEERMRKIKALEASGERREEMSELPLQKPVFTTPLQNQDNIVEGDRVHLECRLEPINDPNLRVEWYVNGVEIKAGHRFRTTHDFGYVALDVLYAYAEDSGTYLCKATNKLGEAVNSCSVTVSARRSIYLDTQHPDGWQKIQNLESRGRYERMEVADLPEQPPRFTSDLRGNTQAGEMQRVHLEGRIEPVHDPSMRVEWYHNGVVLQSAARFHTTFDFGYVALDITTVYESDSGEYTCKAFNHKGEAVSSISITVEGKEGIIYQSARPEGLEKIKELEDRSRYARTLSDDNRTFQRPVFTQPLQNLDRLQEADMAHFECRLIPVGDPNLKVEWYRNETLIETSSRINRTHDFGYVALDISGIRADDEGIYMCRAHNELGEAVTTASMKIRGLSTILTDTQHPEGMRKIEALEARKLHDHIDGEEKVYEKPVFTAHLVGPAQVMEGQSMHFECRVVPVGDVNMRYEWFCNGTELKTGSRFVTNADFGYVTLDISKAIAEDSGIYMCKAYNLAGEAISSCTSKVIAKDSVLGDSLHPQSYEQIRLRETQWNRVPQTPTSPDAQEPPMFTKHLESNEKLQEGGSVHLEGQVQPAHDPHLSIEWYKNGLQLTTGSRVRSTFDFGHVTLDISGLRADDSGIYTCRAVNRVGEAVSTCTIKVFDRDWLIGESVRPEALSKIANLEAPRAGPQSPGEPVYDVPVFITHLNNVECRESDNAHFECRVEPAKDPTMKIEWFINGKPLQAAARYHTTYDFGYVSLDCTHCYGEDSGMYMCKATNSKGSATTTGTLRCTSKASLYFDTQHPQGRAGLEKVEEAERAYWAKYQRQMSEKDVTYPKPFFIRPLQANFSIVENQTLQMEANVEPKNDPDLKIEWFLNGKPLEQGSRFRTSYDFGLVSLDLQDCYERDQGIYTCRAYNKAGEAWTTATVVIGGKDTIIDTSQHPAGAAGLEAIARLEESMRRGDRMLTDEEGHAPRFTTEFKSISNMEEGNIAHFEAMLIPVGDQTMKVEWFYKGQELKASHRVRTVYAFGMVVMEILGTKVADCGEYTCRATNKWGTAECSFTFECVDRAHGQPPKFTTHIKNVEGLKDGDSAHFECTLIPIGDPNMKVEWFHNGEPLRNATRIKMVSDFGYVVMDIAYTQSHDSGEWVCKASNKYGEDYTKAYINCKGRGGVYTDSLQPGSLDRIAELEAQSKGPRPALTPTEAMPPKFITQINNIDRLAEGQSAHFEARLKPVGDPNLNVEWYKDGKKLPTGHRFRTFHDFGIVILDILYCYEEDSGVYEARAVNTLGEDKTTSTLSCSSKTGLILTPQVPKGMEGGLSKIQKMEDSAWMRRETTASERIGMAPKFTVPLANVENMKEGENAHFEARLVPTDDPRLKVEWYWNGKPMKVSSRIRQFCDFGFVIMELSPVYPEDSGEYMCRAYNDYGEAVTKCTLRCEGKRSIILESQLPASMQKGMEKIAELEGLMIKSPELMSPESGSAPQFITKPEDQMIMENQLAHFECRLMPVGDPNLRIEWYHNGRALSSGSRIKTIHDFGYVILEMANCYGRDSGTYTCRAINKHGEASTECTLTVSSKSGIILEPQAHHQFKNVNESIQKLEESMWKREDLIVEDEKACPPRFITDLENITELVEGQPAHFDCRVEPVGDASMRIEWFHNGMPLAAGSRVHMMDDFGFVVLDLEWTFARDTGEYLCRATNKWGTAMTKASLNIRTKHGIDVSTQLPQGMTAEKLKELERGPLQEKFETETELSPPKFTCPISSFSIGENERAFFECRVEPRHDPNLRIEWYHNGQPLQSGSRYRTSFEMGHVSLELLQTVAEDTGDYTCRAVNKLGQDLTKASLKVAAGQSVVMHSQVPKGMQQMDFSQQMEQTLKKYCTEIMLTQEDIYDIAKRQPPRFVTHIKDQLGLKEMEGAKFDCQLAPVGDPNMKVEWFFNGRPLPYKNRFTPIYDFGYVALQMNWVFGEDSGEYLCRATNKYGMDETRANLKSTARPGVIYDSQLPVGKMSLDKIRELEAQWDKIPEAADEVDKPRSKPEILLKPENVNCQEGEWARFSVRVSGHPRPRVMWIVNGNTAMSGNRFKIWYDGIYHLDIPKTRQYDSGKIEVMCRNALGQAYGACELNVKPRQDDYRAVLKNSPKQHEPGSKGYRKPDWVIRMEELKQAMSAEPVKPHFVQELVNSRVKEMGTVTFTATIGGNPKPEVSWYLNQKLLHQHQFFQMRVRNDKAMLTIVNASPFVHKGEYSCKLYNSEGEAFSKARLDVIELTYEEKLNIEDERYAAVMIEHAAEIMKDKEHQRRVKEREDFKLSLEKMKEEKAQRQEEMQRELEAAKTNQWKPDKTKAFKPKEEVKEEPVYQTPTERRIAQVYTNWKTPIKVEESYPELEPEDFAPNQIPGVKCFVQVSETSVKGEEVVRDVAPQFFDDEHIIDELAKIHTMLRNHVKVSEIWHKFRAGEFKCLQQPSIQSALVKICEFIGHQRNVSLVLAQEAKEQSVRHPVGLKAFMRMLKFGSNIKTDKLFGDTIPKEMGKWSSTAEELKQVSQMINQGVETEEIIATCEAGKLPSLKKPETQQPLINIVEKHGHSVMVAQVLVEEAYRDAKDERLMVDRAWEVVHEQEMATAMVTEVKTEMCVPGFKGLVKLATESNIDLEKIELKPTEKKTFEKDIAQLSFQLKKGTQVKEVVQMMKEGEFVSLRAPECQANLLEVVDRTEHATVNKVLVQEASERKTQNVGIKAVMKALEQGEETMENMIMEVSREFGPSSEPVKDIATIGHLLQQGVKCHEVISLVEAGQLPSLQKPAAQSPLVSMVAAQGHIATVCNIIVEESTKDISRPKLNIEAARMTDVKEKLQKAKACAVDVKTFTPSLASGVKAFVRMAQEEKVSIEEVIQNSHMDKKLKEEVAKIGMMVKHGVMAQDVFTLMESGEFPMLMRPEAQASLTECVEEFGFHAFVNEIVIEEAVTKSEKTIGAKSFVRMLHQGKVNTEQIIKGQMAMDFAPEVKEGVVQEMAKVSIMIKEGIQEQQIMSMMHSGQLPSLNKPEVQLPLINIVESQGQSAITSQVIVEEAIQDIIKELPKVDVATIKTQETFQTASASEVIVRAFEIATPTNVKMGDALRAVATYVADEQQENAMHLVEGERVYVQETSNSDWWFCKKHLTLEQGYVPAKLLAEEVSYTHYVQQKLSEKIVKLPVFDKLKKGQKSESPSMPAKLTPKTVKDGQEVQFEVKVNGVPRPTITWFRQTAIIKPSDEFQVFYTEDNTATLVIKEVFPEDAGLFTCVAKNLAGVASSSAEMVVEGPIYHSNESRKSLSRESSVCDILEGIPPTFANRPTVKTVEEGAQIEIDVRLVAIPEAEITWKKDGQVLRESQRLRLVKQKDVHAYRLIIIIKGAKTDDIGTYEIIAKNREGVATNQVQLRVVAPQAPKIEEKFQDQTVEEDGTIRLVAKIHGVPVPDVNWSRDGKKIKVEKNVVMTYQEDLAVLEIRNVSSKSHSGKYVCTATNKVGKATHSATVTIGGDVVTFKRGLESCTVEENAEVVLECRTSKTKQCKWFKGKTELKSSEHIIIEQDNLTHRLIINQLQSGDTGKYICQFDSIKTFCNLTVKTVADFVERLQDVEVSEKEKAVLQVQVNNDKAQVTWHKDGEEIDQHNARFKLLSEGNFRKLVLTIATLHDEGEYTCCVGDHECTCELTVRELPAEITRKMKDQTVPKGGKASFEVELTKGDAVITWYMDDKEVRFSDHYQLSIDGKTQRLMVYNCQAEDCGTYKAVVGKSECTATLKVELQDEGDFVKKLPPQMDVNFSTDATFVVEISKDFSVEWYRQGQKISASDKYVIKKAGKKRTLIVKNVSQADAVEYSCILANLKTSCKLNVVLLESAPTVEKQYSKQEIVTNKGHDVTLKVPFKATPKPKAFWYHKGQLLNVENTPKYLPTVEEDCATLTVKTLESHECGEYQCKLCNGCGAAYADFTVKLLDKPSKPGQPEPVKVTNDTVTLNWTVPQDDGGRKITNYMIEHRNIKEQNWVVWNQTEKVLETTVIVTRLITNEEYMFRIAAVNEIGTSEYSMESKSVKVCIPVQPQPPNFTQRMQAVVAGLNQEVVLKCVVSGTPPPNVEWFQDGKPLTSDVKYENFTATYTIKSTHEYSGGMYMCKASNTAGYAECSATVIIQEAPKFEYEERLQCQRLNVGENYNVPLRVIGHPKPRISWAQNDKPLQSSGHIQVRHEESEGMTSIGIKNLTKDDSSVFTITADNSAGKSQISLNLRVVERPTPPIGPLAVSDVTTTSCRLTWKACSYNGGMDITSYYIERKEKSEKQYQKLAEVGPNIFTYVVQNLRENCEYFFRVFACNPLGVSDSLDASVLIKSAFEKPGPPLGPFDVSNMTESSLTLSWEEPDFNGGSPITGYLLEMRESTKKAWKKVAETKEKQTEVIGVKKGTQYCFRVFAINSVGQGPAYAPDEPITAGKKITPPGPPTSLQVIDITTKTVTLAWAPPTSTGGADLIGYVIECRMQGEKKWEKVNTVDPSVTLFCVEQLREQSEYEFRVFAENPVGMSIEAAMTEMVRLKTHATPPSPPTAPLEVRPTGPSSLMIEWGMPESDGGAPLLGYIIAIRDIKRTMWIEVGQVDANFTRLHIKELQEEHEYHVRVFARNEVGSSGPLETEDPVKVIKPTDFVPLPEDDNAPSLSYSTTETLSWMREAGMDADIYSYARGRLLNRDEYFFKVWHHSDKVKSGSPKPE